MSQGKFILLLLVAGSLGIWGCAQGAGNGANAERIRALESKTARLEEDFKASVAARDQLRKKVASLDEERIQLSQQVEQLQLVVKERDSLKQQLAVRTSERDTVQNQFNSLCKGLKTLLGQAESQPSAGGPPLTCTAQPQTAGKS